MPAREPTRFWGRVPLDPLRLKRDVGMVADEIVANLTALLGSEVRVELHIEADAPDGVPDHVVRTVTENARALKFTDHGFEADAEG